MLPVRFLLTVLSWEAHWSCSQQGSIWQMPQTWYALCQTLALCTSKLPLRFKAIKACAELQPLLVQVSSHNSTSTTHQQNNQQQSQQQINKQNPTSPLGDKWFRGTPSKESFFPEPIFPPRGPRTGGSESLVAPCWRPRALPGAIQKSLNLLIEF